MSEFEIHGDAMCIAGFGLAGTVLVLRRAGPFLKNNL